MHRRPGADSVSETQLGEPQGPTYTRLRMTKAVVPIHSSTTREMTMNTSFPSTGLRGRIATAILGALAASLSALSAAADPDPSSASVTVRYADLNIASPSGALVLYVRIQVAAHSACSHFWFKTYGDEARCVQDTIAEAVTQVNEPALSAVYNAKHKTAAPKTLVSQSR